MCERLLHDTAWSCAYSLVEVIAPCLREDEQTDAFHEFYKRVRAAVETYLIMEAREARQLTPSRN
jgi:hypothetical protein